MGRNCVFRAGLVIAGAILFEPTSRASDKVSSTLGEPIVEIAHEVSASLDDKAVGRFVVTRTLVNQGEMPDEVLLTIDLPEGTVLSGLSLESRYGWQRGELIEAEDADGVYRRADLGGAQLDALGDATAIAEWVSSDEVEIKIYPLRPAEPQRVEYTLTAATEYEGGTYLLTYPAAANDPALLAPSFSLETGARLLLRSEEEAEEEEEEEEKDWTIAFDPRPFETLEARLGRVVVSEVKQVARLEIDAASVLEPVPQNLLLVFVVDASHSTKREGIDAQLALARAYLSHVPNARFEIVLFRRFAVRLAGSFVSASFFDDVVDKADRRKDLEPGNGSNLETGLEEAASALAYRTSPARIVFFTDALLRTTFDPTDAVRAASLAPSGCIVHAVIPDLNGDEVTERRDDDHELSSVPLSTGGVLLHIDGVRDSGAEALEKVVRHLVRPIRIEHLEVEGVDLAMAAPPTVLDEGEGHRGMVMMLEEEAPRSLVLRGQLWSRPFEKVVTESEPFNRATAGFVFSEDLHDELEDQEMLELALFAGVVSPVTSFLAVPYGSPPPVKIELVGIGIGGIGSYGCGGHMGFSTRCGGWSRSKPRLEAMLQAAEAECRKKHRPASSWEGVFSVETIFDEIVDVRSKTDDDSPMAACLIEEIWALRLDSRFRLARDELEARF